MNRIHPFVQPAIRTVVKELTDSIGENLSKVVLIGSAIRRDFDPKTSDVDVVILTNVPCREINFDKYDLDLHLPDELALDFQFTIREEAAVEQWSEFELSWEGKVRSGVILYDSGSDLSSQRLPREDAKKGVIAHYLVQSDRWFRRSLSDAKFNFPLIAEWQACRAACRSLQALLLRHDIDPSPKSLRWNIPGLFDVATQACDRLEHARQYLGKLPADLAFQEMSSVFTSDDPQPAKRHVRSVISNARKLISACKRGIDD
jgi:predicted nucleotidyltransferase